MIRWERKGTDPSWWSELCELCASRLSARRRRRRRRRQSRGAGGGGGSSPIQGGVLRSLFGGRGEGALGDDDRRRVGSSSTVVKDMYLHVFEK